MDQGELTQQFELNRARLRGVAYRMLGSLSEAEDAVQEAWLRLNRSDRATIDNLSGWLTTVVSRVCLDMLRGRKVRGEAPIAEHVTTPRAEGADPESEALLADSVGLALMVVLDTLGPAERLAFVLHDLFAVPFDEIASILGRSEAAAKQLASRARRRVRGSPSAGTDRTRQREVVDAFLKAVREGDLAGLLAVLDPDAVLHIDGPSRMAGGRADAADTPRELQGASSWAAPMIAISRERLARGVAFEPAVIDGTVGVIVAPRGTLARAMIFTFKDDTIARIEAVGDPARLRALHIAVL
jgi:RNA polymerase sigma-70 factor (ECF subfamily)